MVTVDDFLLDVLISEQKTYGNVCLPCFKLFLFNESTIETTVTMTADTPWCPPDVPEIRCCSVCGERNCRRGRCIELNSFGLSVTPTADLRPGKCKVFCTLKDMSSILHCPMKKMVHPLDLCPTNGCGNLVDETFPLSSPSDGEQNLQMKECGNNKRDDTTVDDDEAPDNRCQTTFDALTEFLSSNTCGPSSHVGSPHPHETWLREKSSAMNSPTVPPKGFATFHEQVLCNFRVPELTMDEHRI